MTKEKLVANCTQHKPSLVTGALIQGWFIQPLVSTNRDFKRNTASHSVSYKFTIITHCELFVTSNNESGF